MTSRQKLIGFIIMGMLVVAGCTSRPRADSPSTPPPSHAPTARPGSGISPATTAPSAAKVVVTVTPTMATAEQPVAIKISGLPAGSNVDLTVTATDAGQHTWQSDSTFLADPAGVVDLASVAPTSGSYADVEPMGPFDTMRSAEGVPGSSFTWPATAVPFHLQIRRNNAAVAASTVDRTLSPHVTTRSTTKKADGFVGTFSAPDSSAHPAPAIMVLGGSEGGNSGAALARAFAANGIPALSVAYFGEPGLPTELDSIPLEYFAGALDWLHRQAGVDGHHVWVLGDSRGSEAAQLLGAHFPDLVAGVIAASPSNVSFCGYPSCAGSAWTLGGKQIPYLTDISRVTRNDKAGIPVEKINGPVLTICGLNDQVWPACQFAAAITARLDAAKDRWPHKALSYPGAGHYVGVLLPYGPTFDVSDMRPADAAADSRARRAAWPAVLDFITSNSG